MYLGYISFLCLSQSLGFGFLEVLLGYVIPEAPKNFGRLKHLSYFSK